MAQSEVSLIREVCEVLIDKGLENSNEIMAKLLNFCMEKEREQAIQAAPYERSEERKGYANGFKPKIIKTRTGEMPVRIPQVRGLKFYPQSIEKGIRSERSLKLAVAEMYLKGVSTRKVEDITHALCGFDISSTQVSRIASEIDDDLNKWNTRPLGS